MGELSSTLPLHKCALTYLIRLLQHTTSHLLVDLSLVLFLIIKVLSTFIFTRENMKERHASEGLYVLYNIHMSVQICICMYVYIHIYAYSHMCIIQYV